MELDASNDSGRRRVFIVAVSAAIAVAGVAFLAGRLTGGGADDETAGTGDWDDAVAVAADTAGEASATVIVADEIDGRGRCVRVDLSGDAGERTTTERCGDPLLPWDDDAFELTVLSDAFGSLDEVAVRGEDGWRVALAGAVHPDVVRVTAHFGDGAEYSFVTRGGDGWFVTFVPTDVADPELSTGRLVNGPTSLELFRADGSRLTTVDLPVGAAGT